MRRRSCNGLKVWRADNGKKSGAKLALKLVSSRVKYSNG